MPSGDAPKYRVGTAKKKPCINNYETGMSTFHYVDILTFNQPPVHAHSPNL